MAMKEYELAAVTEGGNEDEFFGSSSAAGGDGGGGQVGIDAGQRSFFDGELKMDEEKGGAGNEVGDEGQAVWCGIMSIRFYQQFFNVNTKDVLDRWLLSLVFFKREARFLEVVGDNPDAYGPFWNATSLVFLIAFSTSIKARGHDLPTLVSSTWVVYGFAVFAPVAIWLGFNQLGIPVTAIQAVCAYGYALGPFLLAVILCATPILHISMIALSAAGVISTVFLLRTFTPVISERNGVLAAPVMAALGCLQAVFTLVLLLSFFN